MKNRIEKGDRVKVTFGQGGYFDDIEGVVDYTPRAPGASWVLIQDDGRVIYVRQFETMILLSKPNAGALPRRGSDVGNSPLLGQKSEEV